MDLHDDKDKQKAMKVVSKIPRRPPIFNPILKFVKISSNSNSNSNSNPNPSAGIDSIAMDMKGMNLTVIGDIDPIALVNKLRKFWTTDIASVGPAKEPDKKKDGGGGGGDANKNKDGNAKKDGGGGDSKDKKKENSDTFPPYYPYMMPYNPYVVTYNPYMNYSQQQHVSSHYPPPPPLPHMPAFHEENPSSCVIC